MRMLLPKLCLTRCLMAGGSVILLAGCSDGLTRTFGLTRDAPDEYTVTTRAPLSMPPDYNLRPPRPGAARPQEQSERQQAEEALVPQLALGAPQGNTSPGQAALLQEAGPPAPANIRREVDADAIAAMPMKVSSTNCCIGGNPTRNTPR